MEPWQILLEKVVTIIPELYAEDLQKVLEIVNVSDKKIYFDLTETKLQY